MIPLTKEEKRSRRTPRRCYICKKKSLVLMITIKNIIRLEIIVLVLGNIEVLLMIVEDIKHQKKFQKCFIMVLPMIIIL